MSSAFQHDILHPIRLVICVKRFRQPVADWSPTSRRLAGDRYRLIANMSPCLRRPVAEQSQTSCKPVADLSAIIISNPNMGIKLLDKSHRSPVSCKEISREQVANRSRSQCKQGLIGVGVSCRISYSIVSYLFVSCSGSIASVDERAIFLLSVSCYYVVFVRRLFLLVLGIGYNFLLCRPPGLPYNYFGCCISKGSSF